MSKDAWEGGVDTFSTLTPMQHRVSRAVGSELLENIGKPLEAYPGEMIAPLIPEMEALRGDFASAVSQAQSVSDSIDLAVSGLFNSISPEVTLDLFKKGVQTPMLRTFQQEIAPMIREQYAGAGQGGFFSSRRGDEFAQQLGNVQTNLSAQLAKWQRDNQLLEAQRSLQIPGLLQQLQQMPYQNLGMQQQFLAPYQAHEQNLAGAEYQEWQRQQPQNSPYLQMALAFLGTPMMGAIGTAPWATQLTSAGIGAVGAALGGSTSSNAAPTATPSSQAPASSYNPSSYNPPSQGPYGYQMF